MPLRLCAAVLGRAPAANAGTAARLPREARAAYLREKLLNPYCYKVGGIAVKLEFDNDAASLQDNLTDFFVRKKNGL